MSKQLFFDATARDQMKKGVVKRFPNEVETFLLIYQPFLFMI